MITSVLRNGDLGGHVHDLLLYHRATECGDDIPTQAAVVKGAGDCGVYLMYWGGENIGIKKMQTPQRNSQRKKSTQ